MALGLGVYGDTVVSSFHSSRKILSFRSEECMLLSELVYYYIIK